MKYDTLDDVRERLDDSAQTEEAMLMRDVFTNVAAPLCSYWDGEHCWSLLAEPAHECACGLERPEQTPLSKVNFATEVAFNTLVEEANKQGLAVGPVMGLMYLPDQAITRQFQEACRAVLKSLGVGLEG